VATKKQSKKAPKRQKRHDWKAIRIAHEVGGKSFRDLSKEFGPHPDTISSHAKKERWRDPVEVRAEASLAVAHKEVRDLVAQEARAVFANRCEHAAVSRRLLQWVNGRIDAVMEKDSVVPAVDAGQEMRRMSLIVRTLGEVDNEVAGLATAGSGFRSPAGAEEGDTSAAVGRIRSAISHVRGKR
jgi:hypothetical protein